MKQLLLSILFSASLCAADKPITVAYINQLRRKIAVQKRLLANMQHQRTSARRGSERRNRRDNEFAQREEMLEQLQTERLTILDKFAHGHLNDNAKQMKETLATLQSEMVADLLDKSNAIDTELCNLLNRSNDLQEQADMFKTDEIIKRSQSNPCSCFWLTK